MFNCVVLSKKLGYFRNFSSLALEEFNAISQVFNEKYVVCEQKRLARVNRKRNIGAGYLFTLI
ncbi:MAG: hypothetical protein FWH37_00575 [Candidatus Bathyarchaeota archaeon]|nr:hypothetical protein [Candidatus Termiticorpusculum sp.]